MTAYRKAYNLFFFVLLLLPVACVCFPAIANPSFDLQTTLEFVTGHFQFPPMVNLFQDMFSTLRIWGTSYQPAYYLICYVSYAFLVLFLKIPFDFVTFLPILCVSAFERKGDKK